MIKSLSEKWPQHARLIGIIDFIIDIFFWAVVIYVMLSIRTICDPTVLCPDIDFGFELYKNYSGTPLDMSNITALFG